MTVLRGSVLVRPRPLLDILPHGLKAAPTLEEIGSLMPLTTLRSVGRALIGHCPACGEGTLYEGVYRLKELCPACGVRHERMEGTWVAALGASVFLALGSAVGVMLYRYQELGPEGISWAEPALVAFLVVAIGHRFFKSVLFGLMHRMGMVTPDPVREGNVIFLDKMRDARERRPKEARRAEPWQR